MAGAFANTLSFLITIVFTLYLLAVLLRFLLQLVKADFYNPICQTLMKITNPPLLLLRKFIPGFYGVDCASLFLLYILQLVELILIIFISTGGFPLYVFIMSIISLLLLTTRVYFYAIILRSVASWFQPNLDHPLYRLLLILTEPLLRPLRRAIPATGVFDWSSLVAIIILMVIGVFLSGLVI